ncbi:MAG TPA: cobalamin B12-binding domain-containing protein [Anaerolineae bacterium]|nr:cobalamin B12-binding domain-containing protein [Anaerolineae bacterium]
MPSPIRVLVAKPGLDGHDRGAKVVAHAFKAAGMEVIYTGLHQTVDQIAEAALQEDVDVIGLSILSGAHLPLTKSLVAKLHALGKTDALLVVGGNIPARDRAALLALGADGVFPTGSRLDEIVDFVQSKMKERAHG